VTETLLCRIQQDVEEVARTQSSVFDVPTTKDKQMKVLYLLTASLVLTASVASEGLDDGLRSGSGYSNVQVNADGSLAGSPAPHSGQLATPNAPDGTVAGPALGPLEEGCVGRNTAGGVLSSVQWSNAWYLHRVVAPRKMRVVSFDFYAGLANSSSPGLGFPAGLFRDANGRPASTPSSQSLMVATPTARWCRANLSAPQQFAKGDVFYIGYKVTSPQLRISITSGIPSTYYWGNSSPWSGPVTSRRFAWRVNCNTPSQAEPFGTSCNTSASIGAGTGSFAQGRNIDASTNESFAWVSGAEFLHLVQAERDMLVTGVSFLSRMSSPGSVECILALADSATGVPTSIVRTGLMSLSTRSRWNPASWEPYPIPAGAYYFVGYRTPSSSTSGFRVSTADGEISSYSWRRTSSSSWSSLVNTRRFAFKVHSYHADAENLLATGNSKSSFAGGATFLQRMTAESDQWVSGLGFRMRTGTGSENVRYVLYRAGASGEPTGQPIRSGMRTVSTISSVRSIHFDPVLIPRGASYYIGFETPTSGNLLPSASGTAGLRLDNSTYYWKSSGASKWQGPFRSTAFSSLVFKARVQTNPSVSGLATTSYSSDARFVFKMTAPSDMWIDGFELLSSVGSGSEALNTVLYTANSLGAPGGYVRQGSMTVRSLARWNPSTFKSPYFVSKGESFFVGVDTPASQGLRFRAAAGRPVSYYWRNGNATSWNRPTAGIPVGLKVHASTGTMRLAYNGAAEIGQTLRIELHGASRLKVYGLVLGLSESNWGPIPLPFDIPLWPGCTMYASYDLLLAAGSTGSAGSVTRSLQVPNSTGLLGVRFYNQFWVLENSSPLEMSWSNGGRVTIGG
jgi:hypothetical protein